MIGKDKIIKKKILVTGLTGFIGKQCIGPLLKKDYEIDYAAIVTAAIKLHGRKIE